MHKVYENDDLMMHIKKRYCHYCGGVLKRKKNEKIVKKGDSEHSVYCTIGSGYKPYGDILIISNDYYCPVCKKHISCKQQSDVIAAQKYYKKKIVTKKDIKEVQNIRMLLLHDKILKLRWILFIPCLGGVVCLYSVFNGRLSKQTNKYDNSKIFLLSILSFIIVALIIKYIFSFFEPNDFIYKYKLSKLEV